MKSQLGWLAPWAWWNDKSSREWSRTLLNDRKALLAKSMKDTLKITFEFSPNRVYDLSDEHIDAEQDPRFDFCINHPPLARLLNFRTWRLWRSGKSRCDCFMDSLQVDLQPAFSPFSKVDRLVPTEIQVVPSKTSFKRSCFRVQPRHELAESLHAFRFVVRYSPPRQVSQVIHSKYYYMPPLLSSSHPMRPTEIPKKIFAYWEGPKTQLVKRCHQSWFKYNPDYEIMILNRETLTHFITRPFPPNFDEISPQGKADWIRLALLLEHGGIWLDSTIIATRSIEEYRVIPTRSRSEGHLFYADWSSGEEPVMENWYIAAMKGSEFIEAWLVEFENVIIQFGNSGARYREHLCGTYPEMCDRIYQNLGRYGPALLDYLSQHAASRVVQVVYGVDPKFMIQEQEEGPFSLHKFHSQNAVKIITTKLPSYLHIPPIIKWDKIWQRAYHAQFPRLDPQLIHPDSIYASMVDEE